MITHILSTKLGGQNFCTTPVDGTEPYLLGIWFVCVSVWVLQMELMYCGLLCYIKCYNQIINNWDFRYLYWHMYLRRRQAPNYLPTTYLVRPHTWQRNKNFNHHFLSLSLSLFFFSLSYISFLLLLVLGFSLYIDSSELPHMRWVK